MVKSMTGFGRSHVVTAERDILVEIRSVNHRFLELATRIPRMYSNLEEPIKSILKAGISRGKVEVSLTIQNLETGNVSVGLNHALAERYVEALREEQNSLHLQDDLSLSVLLRLPDVFTVQKVPEEEKVVWAAAQPVVQDALERFLAMREKEGQKMQADLVGRLDAIEQMVTQVEALSPETVQQYYDRLYRKLQELLADTTIDESRLVTEAGIFAEKIAVDEETVRLRSHLAQFRQLLESGEPIGRKLDFLVQELNREVNTIGSKAQDLSITKYVVDMKAEIEKIREQIQNIE